MLRRLFAILFVGTAVGGISACSNYGTTDPSAELEEPRDYTRIDCTPPLYPASKDTHVRLPRVGVKSDPVILPDCRLTVFERQEVPAQQDGILLCIGTELKPDEPNPSSDRLFTIKQSLRHFEESKEKNKPRELTRRFRLLKEDDYVQRGQLMAILDDRLARDDFAIKTAKVSVSDKDHKAAEKTREEAHQRYLTQQRLFQNGATSVEELRGAELVWNKSTYEAQSKHEAYLQALHEQSQAETVLRMHEIRAGVSGFIKTIYKKQEESVRKYEAVFQIVNLHKLRAEGLLDSQFVRRVTVGMEAIVEPSESVPPDKTIGGHFYDITGLATGYCRDQPVIVSCDESKVRVWNRNGAEIRSFALPRNSAGKSVACSATRSGESLCICSSSNGVVRVWDFKNQSQIPKWELKEAHRGSITCIAVSPDGKTIATGGEDRMICLWNAETGQLRYQMPGAHRGPVTCLQFTPRTQLVSAARDNTLKVWALGEKAARLEHHFDKRNGDLTTIGTNADGSRVLFDEGKKIRVIALPDEQTEGELRNEKGAANFATVALFSPDGAFIVTAGGAESRLQLWRAPNAVDHRGMEIGQLVPSERTVITHAAFSPDGTFLGAAGRDKSIRIWPIPQAVAIEQRVTARVTRVEPALEGSGQVRIWADFEVRDPASRLMPGMMVTLAIKAEE